MFTPKFRNFSPTIKASVFSKASIEKEEKVNPFGGRKAILDPEGSADQVIGIDRSGVDKLDWQEPEESSEESTPFGSLKFEYSAEEGEMPDGKSRYDYSLPTYEDHQQSIRGNLSSHRESTYAGSPWKADSRLMNGGDATTESTQPQGEQSQDANGFWEAVVSWATSGVSAATGVGSGAGVATTKDDAEGVANGAAAIANSMAMKGIALGGAGEAAAVATGAASAAIGIGFSGGVMMMNHQLETTEKFKQAIGNYFENRNSHPDMERMSSEDYARVRESLHGGGSQDIGNFTEDLGDSIIGGGYKSNDRNYQYSSEANTAASFRGNGVRILGAGAVAGGTAGGVNGGTTSSMTGDYEGCGPNHLRALSRYGSTDGDQCFTGVNIKFSVIDRDFLTPMESAELGFLINPGQGGDNGGESAGQDGSSIPSDPSDPTGTGGCSEQL